MLLREFQIAAREQFGAQDSRTSGPPDANFLTQVELHAVTPAAKLPDNFFPHGLADAPTLAAIDAWLLSSSRLRNSLLFEARLPGQPKNPWKDVFAQGFCFDDELRDTKPRVFARDFTGRVDLLPSGKPPLTPVGTALSRTIAVKKKAVTAYGPASRPAQSLRDFDLEHVVGKSWKDMSASEQSTFRIAAAIANVEAGGIIDGINGYDSSVLSAGPYHYTAFPAEKLGGLGPSELGALLAYFSFKYQTQHDELFRRMGVCAREKWSAALFNKSDRTYRAEIGFIDSNGNFPAVATISERNWIRTWPSIYRIQFALRSSIELAAIIWPFARQRIHDLLNTPWGEGAPPGATTIGDVFKSESTVAQLLRWHVYRPTHIVESGKSGYVPGKLVAAAGLAKKPVSTWKDADEEKLSAAFASAGKNKETAKKCSADLVNSLATLRDWVASDLSDGVNAPTLRLKRDFKLFADGIPFP